MEDFTTNETVGSSRQILEDGSFQLNIPGSKSSSFSSSAAAATATATQLLYLPTTITIGPECEGQLPRDIEDMYVC